MKPHEPCSILICAALSDELKPLCRWLNISHAQLRRGALIRQPYKSLLIYLVVTGVGKHNVQKTLKRYTYLYSDLTLAVYMGICGAVDQSLHVADTVIPEALASYAHPADPPVTNVPFPEQMMRSFCGISLHCGGIMLTANSLVPAAEKKIIAQQKPTVSCVDMEAYYAALIMKEYHVPLTVIKTVSDGAHTLLPDESFIIQIMGARTYFLRLKLALRHPWNALKYGIFRLYIKQAISHNTRWVQHIVELYT